MTSLNKSIAIIGVLLTLFGCDTSSDSPEFDTTGGNTDMDTSDTHNSSPATFLTPIDRGDRYALEFTDETDTWLFECIPAGGKITRFALNGHNILIDDSVSANNGSTFWTSPQTDWNWPPPDAFDKDDYTVDVDDSQHTITMTSPEEPTLNVRITKEFRANLDRRAIEITYTIHNTAATDTTLAHWEISRVPAHGLTFFPSGTGDPITDGTFPYLEQDNTTWYAHQGTGGNNKLFSDGSDGWIAHTDGTVVFIKQFADQPASAAAPGEAEIEIYGTTNYVEVEQQGPYQSIPAGSSATWTVEWQLTALRDTIAAEPSPLLLSFVEDQL